MAFQIYERFTKESTLILSLLSDCIRHHWELLAEIDFRKFGALRVTNDASNSRECFPAKANKKLGNISFIWFSNYIDNFKL